MALYVELQKISETEFSAQYRFFDLNTAIEISADNTGVVEIDKTTGEVVEIQHAQSDKSGLAFKLAAGALMKKCWMKKNYLDKLCWAS